VTTAAAPPAEDLHPGDHGADWRQIDMVVAMATPLRGGRYVRATMTASAGHPPLDLVGHLGYLDSYPETYRNPRRPPW